MDSTLSQSDRSKGKTRQDGLINGLKSIESRFIARKYFVLDLAPVIHTNLVALLHFDVTATAVMRYQRFPILEYGNMEIRNTVRVYGT